MEKNNVMVLNVAKQLTHYDAPAERKPFEKIQTECSVLVWLNRNRVLSLSLKLITIVVFEK